jgi:hypothetical protein
MEDADDAVLQQPSQNGSDEEGSTENVLTANDTSQVQTNSAEVAEQALHHYDGTLIDKTNELYDFCFGRPKYPNWVSTNDCLCTTSPFGVVRIDGSDSSDVPVVKNGMFTSTSYIAHRQGSDIAYLPVHGV